MVMIVTALYKLSTVYIVTDMTLVHLGIIVVALYKVSYVYLVADMTSTHGK